MIRTLLLSLSLTLLSGNASAQTHLCRVTEGYARFLAGPALVMPREVRITYEEGGTAIVQYPWFGEQVARRVNVTTVGDRTVMSFRVRRVQEFTTNPTLVFSLTHLPQPGRLSISISALARSNSYSGSGPCRPA